MRSLLLLAAFAMAVPLIAQSPQVTISRDLDHTPGMDPSYIRDIKLWKALQTGDDSTIKSNFSPDFVAIVGDAQQNRDQFLAAFKHCRAGAISLHNHNTKTVSPDSIATSYGLHLEMTCGKQVVAKNDAITMTWDHIKGDKWLIGRITQTPIPPAP